MRSLFCVLRAIVRKFPWRTCCRTSGIFIIVGQVAWLCLPGYQGDLNALPGGHEVMCSREESLRVTLDDQDRYCEPVSYAQLGDWIPKALIAAEDKRFRSHAGIDPIAMIRATKDNVKSLQVVSGASTLSTLVVKLTEPRDRTLGTKLLEAHHAFELEAQLTKDEILVQYLNRASFGGNIIGVRAASKRYFGREPADLTLAEAALLVGLPQSPSRYRPDRFPGQALYRRGYVLRKMLAMGVIDQTRFEAAFAEPLRLAIKERPFEAPHFCDLVERVYPDTRVIQTSLDQRVQALAEGALREGVRGLQGRPIAGAAIVVLEVRSGTVRALVGSPDYWDEEVG